MASPIPSVEGSVSVVERLLSWWRNPAIRGVFFQLLTLVIVVWIGWAVAENTIQNLNRLNITSGYDFLGDTAGFSINFSLVDYSEESSYARALLVGFLNTLLCAVLGIIIATVLGFIIGIARLSHNWIIARLATVYIEIVRNIPLLLQIFFWYIGVLRALPNPRQSLEPIPNVFLNSRGLIIPTPVLQQGVGLVVAVFVLACVASFFLSRWARKRQRQTGQQFPVFWSSLAMILLLPLATFFLAGSPISLVLPELRGFNFATGSTLVPELVALVLALSIYTASFIAEIVRSGIQAVNWGQTEAASSLGLHRGQTLRLVIIPQAMRVIIPPLTNQYLNLTKNSSLAAAIAYPELVSVFAGIVLNITGQAVEVLSIVIAIYLSLSIVTSLFMNWYNARFALVER